MYKLKFPEGSDVIFTSYFHSKENPQNQVSYNQAPKDDLSFIFPWYASIHYLKLNAVIIHDGLSSDFIRAHENDHIQFVYYEPRRYSLNDERYFALDLVLKENILGKVLLTDGSDIIIKKNPFEFMTDPTLLYFGSDEPNLSFIRNNLWCMHKLNILAKHKAVQLDETVFDFKYINAGVYGGDYHNLKSFNEALTILFENINNDENNNMMAINYLLWKFKIAHFSGQPFTSPFKRYELHGNYYIIHK